MNAKMVKEKLGVTENFELCDAHRKKMKKDGGECSVNNVSIKYPVEHMELHDNLRIRETGLDLIKSLMDDRRQVINIRNKIQNQLLAYKRKTDHLNPITKNWLETQLKEINNELKDRDKTITKEIKIYSKENEFLNILLNVQGVGEITAANLIVYIDLEKARHASSLWSYVGLDKPSHARYEKGKSGGGNKTLRTALYVWAGVQIKLKTAYRDVYDRIKTRLENSDKLVLSRNTKGKQIEIPWKETKPCHRNGSAIRIMIKHFLADYWMVGRKVHCLPIDNLYPEAILGKTHKTIQPEERGWKY